MINIDSLNDDEKLAALESIHKSIAESKEIQKKKITTNVEMILKALKKIEGDLKQRYDETGNLIANLKNGTNGRDGKEGRDGKDGRAGKDGAMGPRGYDGLPGRNGLDGEDGVSITDAHIDFDGSLIISLSTGRVINVGEVVTADIAERIKVITNGGGTSQYVLDTLASLQSQISAISSGLEYQGTWNASTNVPALASSVGTAGYYYIVATAGSTNLNGITDWQIGDWAVFNGTVWQKIDQSNLVTSVAGRTGAIVLTTADIGGLGTIATQASSNVSITGGSITGITDLAIADGGTGQSTANAAFNALAPSQTGNSGKYLTTNGTDTSWATNASGTVTSVAASVPTFLSVSGSPITTSGTLAITLSGTALPTANGGTGLTSFTLNSVPYATSTSVLTSDSALMFNGSSLSISASNSGFLGLITQNTSAGVTATSGSGYLNNISAGSYLFTYGSNNTLSVFGITAGDYTGILSDGASSNGILFGSLTNKPIVFGVNNAEQMRLTTTGLGIGTTAGSKLDVKGTLRLSGSTSGYVGLAPAAAAGSTTYTLPSADGTANQALVTNGSGTLSWASTTTGTVTSVAASVPTFLSVTGSPITTSGTLAITLSGTALPTTSGGTGLTSFTSGGVVYASSSSALATGSALTFNGTTQFTYTSSSDAAFDIVASGAGTAGYIGLTNAGSDTQAIGFKNGLRFGSATGTGGAGFSELMRLTSTGLGIGTSSPAYKLDVKGNIRSGLASTTTGEIAFFSASNDSQMGLINNATEFKIYSTYATTAGYKPINFYTSDALKMTLDASGNLGLGVTPSAWNADYKNFAIGTGGELSGRVSTTEVAIGSNYYRNSGGSYIYLTSAAASYQAQVGGVHYWFTGASGTAGDAITFTQAMTLDASGNLGVGTTSPAAKLHVSGDAIANTFKLIANTTVSGSDATIFRPADNTMAFSTNGAERARIDSSGNLLVGVTSANANGGVLQLKSGITFPATAVAATDANTLDDYEEGTWTPSLGGTTTYTQQVGEYTKIGRIVYLRGTLQINVLGTGSTTAVSGIPFNGINKRASGSCGFYATTAVNVNQLTPVINSATMSFVDSPALGTGVTDAPAIFGNGTFIFFTVTYQV